MDCSSSLVNGSVSRWWDNLASWQIRPRYKEGKNICLFPSASNFDFSFLSKSAQGLAATSTLLFFFNIARRIAEPVEIRTRVPSALSSTTFEIKSQLRNYIYLVSDWPFKTYMYYSKRRTSTACFLSCFGLRHYPLPWIWSSPQCPSDPKLRPRRVATIFSWALTGFPLFGIPFPPPRFRKTKLPPVLT